LEVELKNDATAAVTVPPATQPQAWLRLALLGLMAFFLFALPLVEVPKNLAAVLFVVAWAAHAAATRDLGGPWNRYDTVFALMLVSGLLSGLAGFSGSMGGVFRVFLLSWVISRTRLQERDFRILAAAACAGLLLAVPVAAVNMMRGAKQFFELLSVGHVNQSALYLAILAPAAFGWWFQLARSHEASRIRTFYAVCATVFWASLLVSASRGAILPALVAVLATGGWIALQSRHPALRTVLIRAAGTLAVVVALVGGLAVWAPGLSDNKLSPERLLTTYSMHNRIQHWRIAYEGWRQHPWLGWGPEAFQKIPVDKICTWRAERGQECNPADYVATKHAHSLYLATLAECGLLGVLALAALAAAWAGSLLRSGRSAPSSPLWVASLAGLIVVLVGGFFNTTLRVEHGSLAVGFFALWIAAHGRPGAARAGT